MTIADITDRLSLSRERMREALQGQSPRQRGDSVGGRRTSASMPWLATLKALPAAGVIVDALSRWWAQHPLRIAVVVASSTAKAVAEPIAQRNPLGLVLGTALLGGVFVWSRPWRWLWRPALFAGLAPQLLRSVLARAPAQSSAN